MDALFGLGVLLFIGLVGLIVVALFVLLIVKGVQGSARRREIRAMPLERRRARVATKRTEVAGGGDGPTTTRYFATFDVAGGGRVELRVPGTAYGQVADGDEGVLTTQGPEFREFLRGL